MIFNSSGIKQYKSRLWDFDFQSSIWNKNQMDENHTDQVSLTIGLKTWKKKRKEKSIIPKFSLWSWEQGCKAMTSRHVPHSRLWTDGFPSSEFWALSSDFRVAISVFGNQKIPAINFRVLILEIQKTDWPQSFLIKLNWDWDQWF